MKNLIALAVLASAISANAEYPVIGKFRNTYYYSVQEKEYVQYAIDTPVLNLVGDVLVDVSLPFKKAMDIEGTGKLRDGKVLNYNGKKDGIIRYRYTKNPHGDGVGDCALVPFHTVAVDPKEIPLGSLVEIEETKNIVLYFEDSKLEHDQAKLAERSNAGNATRYPEHDQAGNATRYNELQHDGLWRAEDVGGAIKKDRIDLFVGDGDQGKILKDAGIKHLQALTVRLVSTPEESSCVKSYLDSDDQ